MPICSQHMNKSLSRTKSDVTIRKRYPTKMKVEETSERSPVTLRTSKSVNSLCCQEERKAEVCRKESVNSLICNLTRYDNMQNWLDKDQRPNEINTSSVQKQAVKSILRTSVSTPVEEEKDAEEKCSDPEVKIPLIKFNDGVGRSMSVPDLCTDVINERQPDTLPRLSHSQNPKSAEQLRRNTVFASSTSKNRTPWKMITNKL